MYDPDKKVANWTEEVEFLLLNLTTEQSELAAKTINENKERTLWEILDSLAHAGFRGEILSPMDFDTPTTIVLKSKIEK